MARPTWRGSIGFGLVNVPVQLYTAVRSHTVHFTQLHDETKARVRRKRVDERTGEEVAQQDIVKGYEVGDGDYVVIDPDDLAAIEPESSRVIDISDFVELSEIDPIYYDRPYYLVPDGEGAAKPYRLLADAMDRTEKVAIGKFVMRTKEYLGAIRSQDGLLVLSTMHYADEVADPGELDVDDLLSGVEAGEREVAMAEQLIDSLSTSFDPSAYSDEYQERVMELIEAKAEGQQIEVEAPERDVGGVVDLMSALEQSLDRADRGASGGDGQQPDYDRMGKEELYELAQERDVPGRSSMSKDELVAALSEAPRAKAS